jgi:quercetin dioxygenase-like cupin family protein
MTTCLAIVLVLLAGLGGLARPQTPQTPLGISRQTLFENASVRVLRLKLEPGAMEEVHTHPYDVVVTMLTPGDVVTVRGDKTIREHHDTNYTMFFPKGTRHAGGNYGKEPYEVLAVAIVK